MTVQQFVGMTVEAATQAARQGGFEVVVSSTGLQQLNNEYKQGRVNLKVQDGIVIAATIG
jgi:phosphosulfolactate synthase (CoM biosynthesis protein A)